MPTILVVDDDDIVAKTIERTLRRHEFRTEMARSGAEALKIARRHRPDLVILDVMMPGMDGLTVCQEIRQDPLMGELPVLFLTAKSKASDVEEGFLAGADDYLTKPFNIEELILRVKAILRRVKPLSAEQQDERSQLIVGLACLDSQTYHLQLPHGSFPLTPVQFDLVYHLMVHSGEVFSAHQLLRDVWDYPYDTGSPDLVRVHIKNLRKRIERDSNEPVFIKTILGHGYTFDGYGQG